MLNNPFANIKKKERRLIELGDPQWSGYGLFSSSHDGRYVSFNHSHKVLTEHKEQIKYNHKWLIQGNESEGGRPKPVAFDGENLPFGLLSRDGQTLCVNRYEDSITRVYRLREEAGKNLVVIMKCELDGETRAISGNAIAL